MFKPSDLSFDKEQLKSISEAIFEKGFTNPNIQDFHSVVTGIVANKQIAIMGRLNGLLGKNSGECKPGENIKTFNTVEKEWMPAIFSSKIPICGKDFENSLIAYSQKVGINLNDLTGTDFALWCEELVAEILLKSILVQAYFSDKDIDIQTNAGVLTNDLDEDGDTYVAYFNKIDGLWKQLFAIAVADPKRLTLGLDTKNAELTFDDQAFNDTDTTNLVVTKLFRKMRTGADLRLRESDDLCYLVTQSVADQYETELIFANVAYDVTKVMDGISMLTHGSTTVYAFAFWDRAINEFFATATAWDLPHRAILTTKTNLSIGCESESALAEFDIWYSKDDDTTYIKTGYKKDAKVLQDHLVQVAY
ncbi:MAG: hypothetical protein RLZ10_261 [Bacteroidota bacterium]|jgi:hypothetical protein